MKFYEVVEQVLALLRHEGRVSYRALKREFGVDDDYLEDLKEELIGAKRLAVDEDGRFLVWVGASSVSSSKPVLSLVEGFQVKTPNFKLRTLNFPL